MGFLIVGEGDKLFLGKLKKIRLKMELTQAELGSRVGVTAACVLGWENELFSSNKEHLYKLAEVLNVRPEELLTIRSVKGKGNDKTKA